MNENDFAQRFEAHAGEFDTLGINIEDHDEFSSCRCDTCGTSLAGDRYGVTGLIDGEEYDLRCCTDCVHYIANGELPE